MRQDLCLVRAGEAAPVWILAGKGPPSSRETASDGGWKTDRIARN
jgi:hypothetical protein